MEHLLWATNCAWFSLAIPDSKYCFRRDSPYKVKSKKEHEKEEK